MEKVSPTIEGPPCQEGPLGCKRPTAFGSNGFQRAALCLNIRQKAIMVTVIALLTVGGMGSTSYRLILETEKREQLSDTIEAIMNAVLETRRYEKNILFYGAENDLIEYHRYLSEIDALITHIGRVPAPKKTRQTLGQLAHLTQSYGTEMDAATECLPLNTPPCHLQKELIRTKGQDLVTLAETLVFQERRVLRQMTGSLKRHLAISLLTVCLACGTLLLITIRSIVAPLKYIEQATLAISQGNVNRLPSPPAGRDETSRVIHAFNHLLNELESQQARLVQAEKLSSIGTMAAGIAHQLNNPLNNIATSCQLLLEEPPHNANHERIKRMLKNCDHETVRAKFIVQGLLNFSRAREMVITPTPLLPTVEAAIRHISGDLPSGIGLQSHCDEITLPMDASHIREVLINLITNAIQAIGDGLGQIVITGRRLPHGRFIEICVEDSGVGLPPGQIDKLFDPFFTTKPPGCGTGLGLSVAYGIVTQHQGSIKACNRPQGGAIITLRLPAHPLSKERS